MALVGVVDGIWDACVLRNDGWGIGCEVGVFNELFTQLVWAISNWCAGSTDNIVK